MVHRFKAQFSAFLIVFLSAFFFPLWSVSTQEVSFYVSPSGSSLGDGSINNPWDMATVFSGTKTVPPGSTVYLRQGVYQGYYTSKLKGTASNPIYVKPYPGEHANIKGKLEVYGQYTWYMGFEISGLSSDRTSLVQVSWVPNDVGGGGGIDVLSGDGTLATGNKFINLVIHDGNNNGIGIWSTAPGTEAYGNIISYTGWLGPDRPHGHNIYTQNLKSSPLMRIEDNILLTPFVEALQAYGSSDFANNYWVEGNVIYNGRISARAAGGVSMGVIIGAGAPSQNVEFHNNMVYGSGSMLGYGYSLNSYQNINLTFKNNYIMAGIQFNGWASIDATGNTFAPAQFLEEFTVPGRGDAKLNRAANTILDAMPSSGKKIFVRPNKYQPKRANIIIYNWDKSPFVDVDVSNVLSSGDQFEVRDAQNFFANPVVTGTYSGVPLSIPMTGLTTPAPLGYGAENPKLDLAVHSAPTFGTFVLVPKGGFTPQTGGFDYTLSNGGNKSVTQSFSITNTFNASLVSSSSGEISFSLVNPPEAMTYSFSAPKCTAPCSTTLTMTPSPSTPAGTYPLVVSAVGQGVVRTTTFNLTVIKFVPPVQAASPGPIAHYKFDESSANNVVLDASGFGHDGVVVGTPLRLDGKVGKAYSFTGANPISVKDATRLNLTTSDFSFAFWMKTTKGENRHVLSKRTQCRHGSFFDFILDGSGHMRPELDDNVVNMVYTDPPVFSYNPVSDGQWHHISVVRKSTKIQIYVDGLLDKSATYPGIFSLSNTAPMLIGDTICVGAEASTNRYIGDLDELQIYNRALSEDDVWSLFHNPGQKLVTGQTNPSSPPRPAKVGLYYEAEDALLTEGMAKENDSKASAGKYLNVLTAGTPAATFLVTVPETGTYALWGRILAPTFTSDSFFVSVDGAEDIFDAAEKKWSPNWQWSMVNGRGNTNTVDMLGRRLFQLSAGTHTVVVRSREAGAKIDRIWLTNDFAAVPNDAAPSTPQAAQTQVTVPVFSPPPGTYSQITSVAILNATSGATMHYTLDGSSPSTASPVYSGPVVMSESGTIKAMAVKAGLTNSGEASASYKINLPEFAPRIDFSSSAFSMEVGQSAQISWTTANVDNCTASGAWSGAQNLSGSLTVTPSVGSSTYTMDCVGKNGVVNNSVTISVAEKSVPVGTGKVGIYLEAEAGTLAGVMAKSPDPAASGGFYISAPSVDLSSATFKVDITQAGNYVLWGRVLALGSGADSLYVSVNGSEDIYDVAEGKQGPNWQWTKVNGRSTVNTPNAIAQRVFNLSVGTHTIVVKGREANTNLDRIFITNDTSATPSDAATSQPPSTPPPTTPPPSGVAAVTFNPPAGTFSQATSVQLSSATAGAMIHYTTDGSSPTTSSAAYSGALNVTASQTIKALAVKSGMTNSAVSTASYVINTSTPGPTLSIQQSASTITLGQSVTLIWDSSNAQTCTASGAWSGTKVLDGSENVTPSATGTATYTLMCAGSGNSISKSALVTVNASTPPPTTPPSTGYLEAEIAAKSGVLTETNAQASGGSAVVWPTANQGTVTFSVPIATAGTYYVWARVLAATPGSDSLFVSVDGGAEDVYDMAEGTWRPDWQWTKVNGRNGGAPLTLNPRSWTLAAGTRNFIFKGREANARIDQIFVTNDINAVPTGAVQPPSTPTDPPSVDTVAAVTFSPAAGTYTESQMVALSTSTAGAQIRYTLDGAQPTASSALYTAPLQLTATSTIKALAFKTGMTDSAVSSAAYTIQPQNTDQKEFFVAPGGSPNGNGTESNPWDIATALSGKKLIPPGSTVWLRSGVYRGPVNSRLTGTAQSPVIVRQYPGERATVEGKLYVHGDYGWYWGFEVRGHDIDRTQLAGCYHKLEIKNSVDCQQHTVSWVPKGLIGAGVEVIIDDTNGHKPKGNKVINMVIHDGNDNGLSLWSTSTETEVYGSVVYNNGWIGMDRPHGHTVYTQNFSASPMNVLSHNFFFNSMFLGFQAYGTSDFANNYRLESNAFFNQGKLAGLYWGKQYAQAMIIGAGGAAENIELVNNYTYHSSVNVGYASNWSIQNTNALLKGNLFYGGTEMTIWKDLDATDNVIAGPIVYHQDYPGNNPGAGARIDPAKNTMIASRPASGVKVIVNPNKYEPKRANIIIYNWDKAASVNVDLSGVLAASDQYEILDVQNFYGPAVVRGTYAGGSVAVPMNGLTPAVPVGLGAPDNNGLTTPPHTAPEFGTFIVVPANSIKPDQSQGFNFGLSNGGNKTTIQGSSVATRVTASLVSGTAAQVAFDVSGLPSGATVSYVWGTTACVPNCNVDVTISAAPFTPTGVYPVVVSATGSGVTRYTGFDLTVNPAVVSEEPVPSSPKPVAHWKFDEAAGSASAADAVGSNTGTVHGSPARVPGKAGNAILFDGQDDYVSVNAALGNFGAGDFSLAFWMKSASVDKTIIQKRTNCRHGSFFSIGHGTGGGTGTPRISWELDQDTAGVNYNDGIAPTRVDDNAWHHVTVVRKGNTVYGYIDGALDATDVANPTGNTGIAIISNTAPLEIGRGVCINYFDGALDDVQMYNRALSATEVTTLFNYPGTAVDGSGVPTVSLTFSADNTVLNPGQSATLTWQAGNANSCSASGAWSGSRSATGSLSVTPVETLSTYTLTCSSPTAGQVVKSVVITVMGDETPPPSGEGLYFEAEGAVVSGAVMTPDSTASGGNMVAFPAANSGSLKFNINVPSSGAHYVWARILATSAGNDSVFVSVDDASTDVFDMAEGAWSAQWQWSRVNGRGGTATPLTVNPRVFQLGAGNHTLTVSGREAGAKIDRLFVTTDANAIPSNSSSGGQVPSVPQISAITASAQDVDQTAPGLQFYPGTTVEYSATASVAGGSTLNWEWIYTIAGGPEILALTGSGPVEPVNFTYPPNSAGTEYLWILRAESGGQVQESELIVRVVARPLANAAMTLTSSKETAAAGESLTLTATVTGQSPSGSVSFSENGTALAGCTAVSLSAGKATCSISSLSVGSHTFTANYSGDAANSPASTSAGVTVSKKTSTIALTSALNPSNTGDGVLFEVTVTGSSPTGTVNFKDGTGTLAGCASVELDGNAKAQCTVNSLSLGTHTISAVYSGDAVNAGATSAAVSQVVEIKIFGSSTGLTSSLNPSVLGDSVTLTAAVSGNSPTGTVNFKNGTLSLAGCEAVPVSGQGTAACSLSSLSVGSHSISATYSGDAGNNSSTSSTLNQQVSKAASNTSLSSSPNPAVVGNSIVLTAIVTGASPSGSVTFKKGAAILSGCGSVTIATNGDVHQATCALSSGDAVVGSHTYTAAYSGDANNAASVSSPITQNITQKSSSVHVVSLLNPSVRGQVVTLKAVFPEGATGTVDFKEGNQVLAGCGAVAVGPTSEAVCTSDTLTVGTHSINAVYSGDASHAPSSSSLSQVVNAGAASVTLSSSLNPSVIADLVDITATVAGFSPTGSVNFKEGTGSLAGCSSVAVGASGQAVCSISQLSVGSHAMTAVYSGDSNNLTATSPALTQVVNRRTSTALLSASSNPLAYGKSVNLTATISGVSPGGKVNFIDGAASLPGCNTVDLDQNGKAVCPAAALSEGVHNISVVYSGDGTHLPSTSLALLLTVTPPPSPSASAVSLSALQNPSLLGGAATFLAAVSGASPTGTVKFMEGTATLCQNLPLSFNGTAVCSTSNLSVGTHSIKAIYSGDANHAPSTSNEIVQTVSKPPELSISLMTSSANPAFAGDPVMLTVTVSGQSPTGVVRFSEGGSNLPGCAAMVLDGQNQAACAIDSLSLGSHVMTAVYSGDASNLASSAVLVQSIVAKPAETNISLRSSANPSMAGDNVSLTATVTGDSPTGSVKFMDGDADVVNCSSLSLSSNGEATCILSHLSVGTHTIRAYYGGDNRNTSSTSNSIAQVVNQKPDPATSTSLSSSKNPSTQGNNITLTAQVVGSSPTGTVAFLDGASSIPNCSGVALDANAKAICTVNSLAVGTHALQAVYGGDSDSNPSQSVVVSQVVVEPPIATSIQLVSSINPSNVGQAVGWTATVSGNQPTGTVSFIEGEAVIAGCGALALNNQGQATCGISSLSLGVHSIKATYSGDVKNLASESNVMVQAVTQVLAATTTDLVTSQNPAIVDDAVIFTATVHGVLPTGVVDFLDGTGTVPECQGLPLRPDGTSLCATNNLIVGNHPIKARYRGDAGHLTSDSNVINQTILNKPVATITALTSSLNPAMQGDDVTLTATVSASQAAVIGGTVAFQAGSATINGCQAKAVVDGKATCTINSLGVGLHTMSAIYSGDLSTLASTGSLNQTVNKRPLATQTNLSSSKNPGLEGEAVVLTASVVGTSPTGTVQFKNGASVINGCSSVTLLSNATARCSLNTLTVGSHDITAVYSGDLGNLVSTSGALVQQIQALPPPVPPTAPKDTSSTTLSSSANPAYVGDSIRLTARVSGAAPTGTVDIKMAATIPPGCAGLVLDNAGQAGCNVTGLAVGQYTFVASYSGDSGNTASVSASMAQEVAKRPSAISVSSSSNPATAGSQVTFSASLGGDATGTVSFSNNSVTVSGCSDLSLSGGQATCPMNFSTGAYTITASYSGNAAYAAGESAPYLQTVITPASASAPAATSAGMSSSKPESSQGEPVSFTVNVKAKSGGVVGGLVIKSPPAPTGFVSFADNGKVLSGCSRISLSSQNATCTTSSLSVGNHTITGIYFSDTGSSASTQTSLQHRVK